MWKQPETLHLDMLCHTFDINNSGVIECDDQLCDLQFVTHNLTALKDVCLQHYGNKNEMDQITSCPSMSKISDGSQLKVQDNVVMNFYNTGVVMVQGKNLYAFKDIDFPLLKRAVDTWMSEANESINSEKERRNLVINGHSVTTPVSDMSSVPECDDNESEYPVKELTNKSTSCQNRHSPQGKNKTNSSNKTNTKLASSKRDSTVVTPTPECVHFTPTLLKNYLKFAETTQEIDELLQHNISNSTEDLPATSSQCRPITGNSSIEGTPDCKKC